MYREITIGSKKVPLLANGATPFWYKQIFHKDIIAEVNAAKDQVAALSEAGPELAFIMAKQAECEKFEDMRKFGLEQYYEWLQGFEALDLPMALDQIMDLYMGNQKTTAEPKKKETEE